MTPRPAAQWPGQEQAGSGRCTLAWKIIGWNMFMNRRIVFMMMIIIQSLIIICFTCTQSCKVPLFCIAPSFPPSDSLDTCKRLTNEEELNPGNG